MSRIAVPTVRNLILSNQPQLLLPPPTLQFRFSAACQPFRRELLLPDQLHRTPQSRVIRPNAPIMPLDALRWILRGSDVQRTVAAFQHVTEPRLFAFHLAPTLRTDTVGPQGEFADREFT